MSYNLTLWRVRVTTFAMEKQYVLNIMCVRIPASVIGHSNCMFSVVYYGHLWRVRIYHISPNYLVHGRIFKNKKIEHKISALISLRHSSETFPL